MKKTAAKPRAKGTNWEAVCDRARAHGDTLSDEERRRLRAEALRIVYTADAKTTARSR